MIVEGVELGYRSGGDGVESDEDGELLGGAGIAERVGEDESAWSSVSSNWVTMEELSRTWQVGIAQKQL